MVSLKSSNSNDERAATIAQQAPHIENISVAVLCAGRCQHMCAHQVRKQCLQILIHMQATQQQPKGSSCKEGPDKSCSDVACGDAAVAANADAAAVGLASPELPGLPDSHSAGDDDRAGGKLKRVSSDPAPMLTAGR